jgi:hypothetical protein
MKAIVCLCRFAAVLFLAGAPAVRAQVASHATAGPPQDQPALDKEDRQAERAQQEARKAQLEAEKAQADANRDYANAQEEFARASKELAQANVMSGDGFSFAYAASPEAVADDAFGKVWTIHGAGRNGGRTVVVRTSESDPKEQAELEEDLGVMSHILEKVATEKKSNQPFRPMGINVFYTPGASPLRNFYLDGYGALFLLNVGFPLLPAPTGEVEKEKSETSSTWDEARQELYGQPKRTTTFTMTGEPYDEDRVNRLRDSLVDALRNASNIRGLKPDDWLTVCVFGSAGQPRVRAVERRGKAGEVRTETITSEPGNALLRQSMMTIRVRKSDADALARGNLSLEAFHKRAHVVTYAGGTVAGMSFGGMGSSGWAGTFRGDRGGAGGGLGGGGGGGFGGSGVKK